MLGWLVHEQGIEPHIPGRRQIPAQRRHPSRARTLLMTTSGTPTSALPGRNSGSGKKSIECRALSSMRTG
jgi:hypothetical protein